MAIKHSTTLPLKYGDFRISYHVFEEGYCVSVAYGDVSNGVPVVRIHSSCLFGESFHALDCDCAMQLSSTLQLIRDNGSGVVVYEYAEGRGVGLEKKIQALEIQHERGLDTVEAFAELGLRPDLRSYANCLAAMTDLDLARTVRFASQNPNKIAAMKNAGYEIKEVLHPAIEITPYNESELLTKKHRLGYGIRTV